jgi:hypothetical protein
MYSNLKVFILLAILITGVGSLDAQPANHPDSCDSWVNMLDQSKPERPGLWNSMLSNIETIDAIECLLHAQGNRHEARIGGVTHYNLSQTMPTASVEIAALYYISFLFTGLPDHADGIALQGADGSLNPPGSIDVAYKAYREWFVGAKIMGLETARTLQLSPLKSTNLSWYGTNRM